MREESFVSVIIPAYNGEKFLPDAIASIQRQQHHPTEIIIVDDGSTDGTAQIAQSYGTDVRYAYQTNRGLPATRNKGIELARANLIAFLDVDDVWSDNKLKSQLNLLAMHPQYDVILGRTQLVQLTGRDQQGKPIFKEREQPSLALSMGAGLFRRSLFDKVGRFDESHPICDDWDWFMKAREMGVSILTQPDVVQYYRRHEDNMTNNTEVSNPDALKMLKKSLDRRRQMNGGQAQSLPDLDTFSPSKKVTER